MSRPADAICWQAVQTNDRAYDGAFVYAVQTTGIYCRPSCPSKDPHRENVQFFALAQAAEAQGFRPCKRCQPRALSPQEETAQHIAELCDYIDAHLCDALTLDDLAGVVHWSPYHLQRTFKAQMGISPRQYTDAARMAQFKQYLRAGLSITDAMHRAGYGSSSRLYSKTDDALGMTPTTYQAGGEAEIIYYRTVESPLGWLLVAATDRGLCAVKIGDDAGRLVDSLGDEFPQAEWHADDDRLRFAVEALLVYLDGWQPHFDLPLDIRVTAFQKRVLDALAQIPYGETRSYKAIAAAIGNPKAARAVGNACNKNPLPLLIPCHRVVGSDGSLTGYASGLDRKQHLLTMEQENKEQENKESQ